MKKLYEGKAKILFQGDNSSEVICQFKDSATALNGLRKEEFLGKGILNNKITEIIFIYLEKNGIKTHFKKRISDREQLLEKVEIIPLEVIVRNFSAGSFSKRYGVPEKIAFEKPIFEISLKRDDLGDPLLNKYHALALKIVTEKEYNEIKDKALNINKLLINYFKKANICLADFKLEFGKNNKGEIILADEFSPDNSRLWDLKTGEKLDKDNFRQNIGSLLDAYKIVYERLQNV